MGKGSKAPGTPAVGGQAQMPRGQYSGGLPSMSGVGGATRSLSQGMNPWNVMQSQAPPSGGGMLSGMGQRTLDDPARRQAMAGALGGGGQGMQGAQSWGNYQGGGGGGMMGSLGAAQASPGWNTAFGPQPQQQPQPFGTPGSATPWGGTFGQPLQQGQGGLTAVPGPNMQGAAAQQARPMPMPVQGGPRRQLA